jgi:hypothetical protein
LFWHTWPFVLLAYRIFRDIDCKRCAHDQSS